MSETLCPTDQRQVVEKLVTLYEEAFDHEGFAEIKVEIRILRRGQKEVILHCGKQYRYVVDASSRVTSFGRRLRRFLDQEVTLEGLKPPASSGQ